jgi:hypothetical protein
VLYFENCHQFLSQVFVVRTEIISNGHQRKSNTNSKCRFISDNFFFWTLRQPVVDINNVATCLKVMYLYNVSNRHQRKSNKINILGISFLVNLSNVKTFGYINRRKTLPTQHILWPFCGHAFVLWNTAVHSCKSSLV